MRMLLFGLAVTVVWGGAHYYVGQRLITESGIPRPWNLLAWGLVAFHASLSPIALALRRTGNTDGGFAEALIWVTYVGMGLFVLLFLAVLTKDAVFWVLKLLGIFDPVTDPDDPGRRTMLTSGLNLGIFAASGVATGVGYVTARARPTIETVEIEVPNLPSDLVGYRIVQISDMHIGPTLRRPFVEMVVDVVNGLDADLIAMTGDLTDGTPEQLMSELEPMRQMKSADGAFFVTGNHEYYTDGRAWQRAASAIGMTTLANGHHLIKRGNGRLLVGGVNDLHADRFYPDDKSDPHAAMADAPDHDFSVLLAHQPRSCYAASQAGWKLQLSGHTHGGQFFPWNFFVGLAHPFTAGLGDWEGMKVYVNRGTGYWGPPLRLAIPSEVTVLVLKRAA